MTTLEEATASFYLAVEALEEALAGVEVAILLATDGLGRARERREGEDGRR